MKRRNNGSTPLLEGPTSTSLSTAGLIMLIGLIVFRKFLTFKKLYVFSDIGGDSLYYSLPHLAFWNERFHEGIFSAWSFSIGTGQSVFAMNQWVFDPFNWILFLVKKETFPFLIGYVVLLKSLVSGLFFQAYLRRMGCASYATLVGGVLYAFNGYLILWGQHYNFSTACVCSVFILWALEGWFQKKKWFPLVFSVFATAAWSYYFFFMIAIFVAIYVQFRIAAMGFSWRTWLKENAKVAALSLLGLGLACFTLMPAVYTVMKGSRLAWEIPSLISLASPSYFLTLLSRFYSTHVSMDHPLRHFYDWRNYYEAPNVYTGLLTLLLLPSLWILTRNSRRYLFLCLTVGLLFLSVPFLSGLLNGFSYVSYRWTFLLIPMLLLGAMKALNLLIEGQRLSSTFLMALTITLVAVFSALLALASPIYGWPLTEVWSGFRENFSVILFLVIYLLCLVGIQCPSTKFLAQITLLLMVTLEILVHSNTDVNQRVLLDASYVREHQGIFDHTVAAVTFLNNNDSDFFRIGKSYSGASWNDPIGQYFHGTTSYISLNNSSYLKFLKDREVSYPNLNVTRIPFDRYQLSTLLGVKYHLATRDSDVPFGYRPVATFGKLNLYKNEYSLPIGIAFDFYILEEDLKALSPLEKDEISLEAVVLSSDSPARSRLRRYASLLPEPSCSPFSPLDPSQTLKVRFENLVLIDNHFPRSLEIKTELTDPHLTLPLEHPLSGEFQVDMQITSPKDVTATLWWRQGEGIFLVPRSQYFLVSQGTHRYHIDLGFLDRIDRIRFDLANLPGRYIVRDFTLNFRNTIPNADRYKASVEHLRKEPFRVERKTETEIEGTINTARNKMLVFSIPYGAGWNALVDGKTAIVEKVNSGFSGVELTQGQHRILFSYTQPWLNLGATLSSISLFILMLLGIRFYKSKN